MKKHALDFSKNWIIVQGSNDATAALAARELGTFLERITGNKFPVEKKAAKGANALILTFGRSGTDGFRWTVAKGKVELRGENARGLLYAVYDFLEALGCRWTAPGALGERLPKGTAFDVPASSGNRKPSVKGRCLIIGHAAFVKDAGDWIIWAARNKLNTVFIHTTPEKLATGAAPVTQWLRESAKAVPLLKERGMTVEYGGHFMSSLLPRDLFKKNPEAFRFAGGERVKDYNFCPSSDKARSVIREKAVTFFKQYPYVDVFHVWPDDILGGGWCSCDLCKKYTPSEQGLMAVNIIAGVLYAVNPKAQVSFLAYHDTEKVPAGIRPMRNICMLWAPRKRCYAHDTADGHCRVNVPHYAEGFKDQAAYFKKAGTAPARIFEYYLDEILFKSVLPPLVDVMKKDIAFYNAGGAHTVQALLTGDRPFIAAKINTWLFPRLCWDLKADTGALVKDFCTSTFGQAGAHLPEYYRLQEKAFALALDLSPEEALPEKPTGIFEIFDNPVADVGDPFYAPPEMLRKKAEKEKAVLDLMKKAREILNTAGKGEAPREAGAGSALEAERRYFSLVEAWFRFDLARVSLYAAVAPGGNLDEGKRHLDEAYRALDDIYTWRDANIEDSKFRKNFSLLRLYSWELRLEKIRGDHYSPAWKRPFIKLKNLFRMLWLFITLQGAFE